MSDFPAIQNQYRYPGQYPANPYDGVQVDPTAPPPVGTPAPSVPFYNPWNSAPTYAPPTGVPLAGSSPVGAAPDTTQTPVSGLPISARDTLKNLLIHLADKADGGEIKSIDDEMEKLNKAASDPAANPLNLQAQQMLTQAKQANSLADFMKNNPQAAPELQHAQNVPGLSLPGVPQYVQPTANPVASIGAGIAGLFAPRAAGAFGAAALSGAITASKNLNDAKRQEYQFQLQQSVLKHEDDVRRADAQARIDAQNAAVKNAYSAEEHADNLKQAVERSNASQLEGQAGNLKAFIVGSAPAEAAQARLKQLADKRKQAEQMQIQATKSVVDLGTTVAQLQQEDDKLQQSGAQFQQAQQAAREKLQSELTRYNADRQSREQIANNRNALDAKLGAMTDDRIRYGYNLEHSDRVAKLEQDAINSGSVLKDPKTYETMAAQGMIDDASARLHLAEKELNNPSLGNPNFVPNSATKEEKAAAIHKRQLEVNYAQSRVDVARQKFLEAGAAARIRVQKELQGTNTSPSPVKKGSGSAGADPLGILGR